MMENSQVLTIIASILGPMIIMCSIGFTYLIKHSKELGILEGVFLREFQVKTPKKKG